ncbi:hypothetical protein EsDP_00005778 [Epichloe bromicola]|uniref:Uncharacterized protein n=1 Tax=Epichloe bromicola TaxID=79588 RepID=A0ABQ0CVN7_9HYPO
MDPNADPSHPIERVLAAMSASATETPNDESAISPSSQSARPSQDSDSSDSMDMVAVELQRAIAEPTATIKHGQAPSSFIFGLEPSPKEDDQVKAFSQLLGMSAVVRMFAAVNTVAARGSRKQSKPYSLSKSGDYVAAFNEGTDAVIKALTVGPLAQFYDCSTGGSTQTESFTLKRTELHPLILKRVFSGLASITDEHMKDLDRVLTEFVSALKPYECDPTDDQPNLNHVVLINYIRATDLTGGGHVFVVEPFVRRVYISLKSQEWATALEKPGSFGRNEKIKFRIETTVTEMKLDGPKYQANKAKYEQVLQLMTSNKRDLEKILKKGGLEAFGRKTCFLLPAEEDKTEDKKEDKKDER